MNRRLLIIILGAVCFCNPCFAGEYVEPLYPQYLHGDENFILCDGHTGTAWYVDKSSVVVEEETDNVCVLSVEVVSAKYADHRPPYCEEDIQGIEYRQYEFLYNLDVQKMYIVSDKERDAMRHHASQYNRWVYANWDDRTWRYIDPHGCWADVGIIKYAAIEAYRTIYGTDFYSD